MEKDGEATVFPKVFGNPIAALRIGFNLLHALEQ
jgi:hypothetical protein